MIALGRAMLAALFLAAIWLDQSQPAQAPAATYAFLAVYVAWAIALAAVSWSSWWWDARLGGPAHLLDIGVFTVVVFSTNGYTSPFFLFFVFLLLAAAIRWGWRETAFTALTLIALYLTAGIVVAGSGAEFEEQRFIIRSGHLVILSALLIWFGINQRFGRLAPFDDFAPAAADSPGAIELALRQAMAVVGARSGLLMLREVSVGYTGTAITGDHCSRVSFSRSPVHYPSFGTAFLFDMSRDRAMTTTAGNRARFARASDVLDTEAADRLLAGNGLACAVATGRAEGWLLLGDLDAASADHIEVGRELAGAVATLIERRELLEAMETSAAANARLSLARDLHDSIVQFLAGAAFRLEAIRRSAPPGEVFEAELSELKRLLLDEQREIRGVVSALRRGGDLELSEALSELRALSDRLAQQWSISCNLHGQGSSELLPVRLHLDVQQLLREAVANAVRHGGADQLAVFVGLTDGELNLEVTDNGRGFDSPATDEHHAPWSLKERVERAGGSLMLVSKPGRTTVTMALPLR